MSEAALHKPAATHVHLTGLPRPAVVAGVVVLLLLTTACSVREPRPEAAWLTERKAFFGARDDWVVSGRLGLSDGERGGSLSFRWRARGDHHRVDLNTLTGGRRWILEFGPEGATLSGTRTETRHAPIPEPLVEDAVGWPIPVTLMIDWLRGLPAPPDARVTYAGDGTLAELNHRTWSLTFDRWRQQESVLLPDRLTATSGRYRVRAALGSWTFD